MGESANRHRKKGNGKMEKWKNGDPALTTLSSLCFEILFERSGVTWIGFFFAATDLSKTSLSTMMVGERHMTRKWYPLHLQFKSLVSLGRYYTMPTFWGRGLSVLTGEHTHAWPLHFSHEPAQILNIVSGVGRLWPTDCMRWLFHRIRKSSFLSPNNR